MTVVRSESEMAEVRALQDDEIEAFLDDLLDRQRPQRAGLPPRQKLPPMSAAKNRRSKRPAMAPSKQAMLENRHPLTELDTGPVVLSGRSDLAELLPVGVIFPDQDV